MAEDDDEKGKDGGKKPLSKAERELRRRPQKVANDRRNAARTDRELRLYNELDALEAKFSPQLEKTLQKLAKAHATDMKPVIERIAASVYEAYSNQELPAVFEAFYDALHAYEKGPEGRIAFLALTQKVKAAINADGHAVSAPQLKELTSSVQTPVWQSAQDIFEQYLRAQNVPLVAIGRAYTKKVEGFELELLTAILFDDEPEPDDGGPSNDNTKPPRDPRRKRGGKDKGGKGRS